MTVPSTLLALSTKHQPALHALSEVSERASMGNSQILRSKTKDQAKLMLSCSRALLLITITRGKSKIDVAPVVVV